MGARPLSDDQIKAVIEAYLANNRNITHTCESTTVGYGAINKYVRKWQAGQLRHIAGLPEYDAPSAAVIRAATDSDDPTATATTTTMRRQTAAIRKERDMLLQERDRLRQGEEFARMVRGAQMDVPRWLTKSPRRGEKSAIPTAILSDLHLDEVVYPAQVNYVNAYNREIAEKRLQNFFNNVVELSRDYLHGLTYEGMVLPLGGDIFSGIIHEELVESNAATIFESLLYWAEPMASGIRHLRDVFGRVFLPCVVGNHGRRQRKPHAKNRAQDNFDYFFYHLLAKLLSAEKGITFAISEAADQPYVIYSTRYLLTHGDQFRGGSGIAGLLSPLMIGDARKRQREQAVSRPYDYMIMGHWHQLSFLRNLIVNGSLKGYDEYAYISNFHYEPPRQAFWITDAKHGVTIQAPIHVASDDEDYSASAGSKAVVRMGGEA